MRANRWPNYSLFLLFLLPFVCAAQSTRPKVGLVLSGGAAKGLAHIPLLKALDSLGIVPDYITGTSMGSIIGGLYAAGYSGDSLETLTTQLPWNDLLSDKIPFRDISIEEKDEFNRYILELGMQGIKPQIPLGLVSGQRIEQTLWRLTYPVSHINDFNQLPIPFNCVASDVVNGKPYVFKSGSLSHAMRASMAIPMFFTPVKEDSLLLVDGMMFSNLPVSYCRDMGADFIIGCDVGGGLFTKDDLTSMPMILYQAAILGSNADFEKQKADCDIFVNAFPFIRPGPLDFDRYPEILTAGDSAVQAIMPQLVALAERLRANPGEERTPPAKPQTFTLRHLSAKGLSHGNKMLTFGKFGLEPGDTLNFDRIEEGLARMYGTRLFNKVGYQVLPVNDTLADVLLKVDETLPTYGKFALHYDTERGAGLILNYTARNILGNGSRLVASGDIAEAPRARVNFYRYLDPGSRYWVYIQGYFERQIQNSFYGNSSLANLKETYYLAEAQFRRTIRRDAYAGVGFQYEHSGFKPKVDPADLSVRGAEEIEKYDLGRFSAVFRYELNTTDQVYYPTKGLHLFAETKGVFANTLKAEYLLTDTDGNTTNLSIDDPINPYLRFQLRANQTWKLHTNWSCFARGELGTSFEAVETTADVEYNQNGIGDFFQVGGSWQRPRQWVTPFWGLREQEIIVPHYLLLQAGVQWRPFTNLYVMPALNALAASNQPATDWWSNIFNFNFTQEPEENTTWHRTGAGITLAYSSVLGPLQFTLSRTFETGQLRAFLNLGYTF